MELDLLRFFLLFVCLMQKVSDLMRYFSVGPPLQYLIYHLNVYNESLSSRQSLPGVKTEVTSKFSFASSSAAVLINNIHEGAIQNY